MYINFLWKEFWKMTDTRYEQAKKIYAALGVDTDKAVAELE